ncbi:MAG TPA: glycosyltransferase family 39 protein [Vicinamibacteria bacterium]|nr:glycosyltransferase family 39 protein [Vicinamibacteria bacterium]
MLGLKGRDAASVWLDGALVFDEAGGPRPREQARVDLGRGLHSVRAEFRSRESLPVFKLTLTSATGEPVGTVFPNRPSRSTRALVTVLLALRRVLPAALVLGLLLGWSVALRFEAPRLRWLLVLLLVLYSGSLRLESVVRQYWGLAAPAWARQVTALVSELRPSALKLPPKDRPYAGDPSSYLRYARAMEHFYDAHAREPLFVAATKAGLALAGGADIGISLASTVFSTLMVLALYLLGAECFGHAAGLLAALLLAIEPQVIGLAPEGWRDEAFSLFVLLTCLGLVRLQTRPSFAGALGVGMAGGLACLTRITSLSFLIPALLYLCLGDEGAAGAARRRAAALASIVALALIAPYLASCAIAFGDPFLAINTHTGFYRSRAGLPAETGMSWGQYLATSFGPVDLVRKMVVGRTIYPFANKWLPYTLWLPGLATVLRVSSLVGLVLFLKRRQGRLLLVVLFAALLPFAFTWDITGGREWRLTLVAYPFYLLAAAFAADCAVTFLRARGTRRGAAAS